jgi:DNA recombination protein RmuC
MAVRTWYGGAQETASVGRSGAGGVILNMDTYLIALLIALGLLLLVILGLIIALLVRRPAGGEVVIGPLQTLTQSLGGLQGETRALAERIASVERNQVKVGDDVGALATRLVHTGALTQGLTETAASIREGLGSAQETLSAIRSQASPGRSRAPDLRIDPPPGSGDRWHATAARLGKNIIDLVLAQLPAAWQVRNFQIGNKIVEFGLRLPNNLVLPIDSKWTAVGLLEQLAGTQDPDEGQRLKAQIEKAVLAKAREVRKYIDPSVTASFGIAAVPDAVYDVCSAVWVEVMEMGVVLLSYSLFIPYLLLVYQTTLSTSHDLDLQQIVAYVRRTQESLTLVQGELEGRLSKAITMLENSRDEMRLLASRAAIGLTSLQLASGSSAEAAPPPSD